MRFHRSAATALVTVMLAVSGSAATAVVPRSADQAVQASRYADAVSHPRADPYYPREGSTGLDALHYGLNLSWNAAGRILAGTATIRFRATRDESTVSLDLGAPLEVSAVTLDGTQVAAAHRTHKLWIRTGRLARDTRHVLVIRYRGSPKPFPAPTTRSDIPDLGWTVQPDGEVWTMQEPYGAFTWYPVNDQPSDKAFYDVTVHTKPSWRAVSNGRLVGNRVSGNHRTMHWRLDAPAASYLVTIAIGPYHRYRDSGPHHLPISYWLRPVDRSDLRVLRRTPHLLRWLESMLGPYPYDSLGTVVVPSPSGMETQTMVTLGDEDLDQPGGVSDLLHEYSHQWYGDSVTPKTWPDLWLNESFAMYLQIRWEASHGYATMSSWRTELDVLDQQLRDQYGPPGRYDKYDFGQLNVYFCGARMLDRLHSKLGNATFERVLEGWPARFRYRNADRLQWIRFLDKTSGRNLRAWVTRWLDSNRSPV